MTDFVPPINNPPPGDLDSNQISKSNYNILKTRNQSAQPTKL